MPREVADDGGTIRAFFGLELGGAAREAAAELSRRLRGAPGGDAVRWVRPESLHVTLRFLGDVERAAIPPLAAAVAERVAPLAPFRLGLGAVRGFPSPRRARVVALELTPPEPLAELAAAVERGVVAAGLPAETRPFRGHLTLGRVRERRWRGVTAPVTAGGEAFDVTETVLFRSLLGGRGGAPRAGSQYDPLERIPLRSQHPHHP